MRNNNWEPETEYPNEPWNRGTYQTGSTQPPKSHGGLIAVLLALVIFLGGISSALGILNIRLFRQISNAEATEPAPVMFSNSTATLPTESVHADPKPDLLTGDMELSLSDTPEGIPNIPQEGGLSLQEIYAKAIDSVVSILCDEGSSTGTGVVLTSDGYIVTNCHVVENATSIAVCFTDGSELPAVLIGEDTVSDLAVLYVQGENLTPAEFGDSDSLQVGDTVVAIGDPLGVALRGTMTDGIVSAINRNVATGGRIMTLIQTNAALNAGNSGGPLLNCYGQVIGINTMKIGDYMSSAGVEGLGFAIPSTTVKDIVDQLFNQGYVSGRPTLGISGFRVSDFYQLYYRLPDGLYIEEISAGSGAAQAGLQVGDILLQVGDTRITDMDDLNTLLYNCNIGDRLDIIIYRSGVQYTATLVVEEYTG